MENLRKHLLLGVLALLPSLTALGVSDILARTGGESGGGRGESGGHHGNDEDHHDDDHHDDDHHDDHNDNYDHHDYDQNNHYYGGGYYGGDYPASPPGYYPGGVFLLETDQQNGND